ncbi:unnamed protein product [Moneuplotes crassus]|uniref:Rhomboid-like protease n=1 Tax=Euplotes crassus TaxID=5936 RepID=A0AAD2D1M0_EUPCR|nr:unnamed protein product [Moneuplotes crassus]
MAANIRGFRDYNTEASDHERQRLNPGQNNNINGFDMFSAGGIGQKQPKDENYWNMLQYNLCPKFKVVSFTFAFTIINLVIFLTVFCFSLNNLDNDDFMGIPANKLSSFGAKNPYKIRNNYEVFRWVVPIFLHANFMHIFFNSVTLFWVGFNIEHNIGALQFFIVYMLSGIGGFIFSSCVSDSIAVGASGAIFGIISVMFVNLLMNWRALYNSGALMPTLIMILLLVLMAFASGDNADTYGHFGGLLTGFLLGVIYYKYDTHGRENTKRLSFAGWVALFFYVGLTAGLVTVFFTVRHPSLKA